MRTSKIQFPKRFSFFFLLFCILGIMGYARSQQILFSCCCCKDGTGGLYYSSVGYWMSVPENLKSPWLIFVKNGSYEEQVIIPQNKPFIHLIGQDKERTIIHLKLNVGGNLMPILKIQRIGIIRFIIQNLLFLILRELW